MNDVPMALAIKAHQLHAEQRDVEAARLLEHALKLEPTLTGALFLKGIIALSHGDYRTGLPLFELRHQRVGATKDGLRHQELRQWSGQQTNRRVVIWAEEGLGDTIQMLRYVPLVKKKCPNLVLEVQPSLVTLCRQSFPDCTVVTVGGLEGIKFEAQCSLLSLPLITNEIPSAPYLVAGPCLRTPQRIGICWYGNPASPNHQARSIPFEALEPLAEQFDFISLQQTDLQAEDVAATAAVINQLDFVVTADTMIAHLAGALGKQVWIMLAVDCDWRWLQKRNDSPWYKTATLFRQKTAGNWSTVIQDVATNLAKIGLADANRNFLTSLLPVA